MKNRFGWLIGAGVVLGVGGVVVVPSAISQEEGERSGDQPAAQGGPNFGQMLVDGLRGTEGCVGVEVADMQYSGMSTIIAWFENREAAERWYYSPTHRFMMQAVGSSPENHKPLQHVPNPDEPLMVMASIKPVAPGEASAIPGPMPISAISIEVYQPVPGGAAVGGRLLPAEIEVEHFNWIPPANGENQ